MKELTIEQKAQRYDEAIAHVKLLLKTIGNATLGNLVLKNEFENMFPELKESEDERIRKDMKEILDKCLNIRPQLIEEPKYLKAIAWLEKQGEHNHIDKIELKFKVGDVMRTFQEAANNITSGLPVVVSIDEEYYHCTNELIPIKDQDDYEYPPMNRAIAWSEEKRKEFIGELQSLMFEWSNKK